LAHPVAYIFKSAINNDADHEIWEPIIHLYSLKKSSKEEIGYRLKKRSYEKDMFYFVI